jgi:hypothetical protein
MAEPRSDDRSQARREAAILLGVDIDHLSPADGLRVDMVSALRLVIDHEQSCVLSGGSADLGKLNVAVQSLIALLPGRELPAPESQREDARVVLWNIIKEGRDRAALGFEGYDGKCKQIEALQAEVAALKARLGLTPALPDVTGRQVGTSGNLKTVITNITPPGEYLGVPPMSGPDDPPKPRVIEGKANPPAASAAPQYDYSREQGWKDYVEPDGSIRSTPRSRGHDWGPV